MYNVDVDLRSTNRFLRKVFVYMALGILISFGAAFYTYSNYGMMELVYTKLPFFLIAEIVMVLSLRFAINKISSFVAGILFFGYSLLTGLTLSGIGLAYKPDVILYSFIITFVIFVVMAVFGYTTKEDLSSYRRFFTIGLISLIILGIINIFLRVGVFYWIGTVLGVVVFTGLIAYDVNRIKIMAYQMAEPNTIDEDYDVVARENIMNKYAIIGALTLYLDFVNLFLYILRIFGRKR